MEQTHWDIIVIGLGAMGSASFYHAAKTGKKVLGIEQYSLAHNKGSSHGETRIIREVYMEGEFYVKMAQRAALLWQQLEKESGSKLYERNGCLMVGETDSKMIMASKETADIHNLPYKEYNPQTLNKILPEWKLPEGFIAILDESAGLVYPERCIESHIKVGTKLNQNAIALFDTKVIKYQTLPSNENHIEVQTDKGTFKCSQLILSAGLWTNQLLQELQLPLVVQKQYIAWFDNQQEEFKINKMPCFYVEYEKGKAVYGFPNALGTGVKIGLHYEGEIISNVSQISYEKNESMYKRIQEKVLPFLPTVAQCPIINKSVCFYTITPDDHFIIDFHPKHQNIVILSPCSGHGFKFSSAIGEMAMKMLETKQNPHTHFKISRFTPQQKL